jgi:hypothetical protein
MFITDFNNAELYVSPLERCDVLPRCAVSTLERGNTPRWQLTNDNTLDRNENGKSRDGFLELVEIDLLYAAAELRAGRGDPLAQSRAFQHIEHALENIRAQRTGNEAA